MSCTGCTVNSTSPIMTVLHLPQYALYWLYCTYHNMSCTGCTVNSTSPIMTVLHLPQYALYWLYCTYHNMSSTDCTVNTTNPILTVLHLHQYVLYWLYSFTNIHNYKSLDNLLHWLNYSTVLHIWSTSKIIPDYPPPWRQILIRILNCLSIFLHKVK